MLPVDGSAMQQQRARREQQLVDVDGSDLEVIQQQFRSYGEAAAG